MTESCENCGAPVVCEHFDEIADLAFDAVISAAKTILAMRSDEWPDASMNDFTNALLAGFLSGTVAAGFSLTKPEGRDAVMDYLRDYLPIARDNLVEPDDASEEALQ